MFIKVGLLVVWRNTLEEYALQIYQFYSLVSLDSAEVVCRYIKSADFSSSKFCHTNDCDGENLSSQSRSGIDCSTMSFIILLSKGLLLWPSGVIFVAETRDYLSIAMLTEDHWRLRLLTFEQVYSSRDCSWSHIAIQQETYTRGIHCQGQQYLPILQVKLIMLTLIVTADTKYSQTDHTGSPAHHYGTLGG